MVNIHDIIILTEILLLKKKEIKVFTYFSCQYALKKKTENIKQKKLVIVSSFISCVLASSFTPNKHINLFELNMCHTDYHYLPKALANETMNGNNIW